MTDDERDCIRVMQANGIKSVDDVTPFAELAALFGEWVRLQSEPVRAQLQSLPSGQLVAVFFTWAKIANPS